MKSVLKLQNDILRASNDVLRGTDKVNAESLKIMEATIVTTTLTGMNEYNASGNYIVGELWNFNECRKATLVDAIESVLR